MKTPFTSDQFLGIFRAYNLGVFPMQIIFYLLGIVAIYLVVKPNTVSGKIISSMLAFFWLWMGMVYHLLYFAEINKAAYLFGLAFIVQGILFAVFGIFQDKLLFKFYPDRYGIFGISLLVFALLIYPIMGYFLGHRYPNSPTFGLACPAQRRFLPSAYCCSPANGFLPVCSLFRLSGQLLVLWRHFNSVS